MLRFGKDTRCPPALPGLFPSWCMRPFRPLHSRNAAMHTYSTRINRARSTSSRSLVMSNCDRPCRSPAVATTATRFSSRQRIFLLCILNILWQVYKTSSTTSSHNPIRICTEVDNTTRDTYSSSTKQGPIYHLLQSTEC